MDRSTATRPDAEAARRSEPIDQQAEEMSTAPFPGGELRLPFQNEDACRVGGAIHLLAARITTDLADDDEAFYTEGVESWRVVAADLYGEVPAVAALAPDGATTVLMVSSNLSPIQQLRALLAEVEARLGN